MPRYRIDLVDGRSLHADADRAVRDACSTALQAYRNRSWVTVLLVPSQEVGELSTHLAGTADRPERWVRTSSHRTAGDVLRIPSGPRPDFGDTGDRGDWGDRGDTGDRGDWGDRGDSGDRGDPATVVAAGGAGVNRSGSQWRPLWSWRRLVHHRSPQTPSGADAADRASTTHD